MTRLIWDGTESRQHEAGVDRGVFYPSIGPGVPWNGLTKILETVESNGSTVTYMDGKKIVNQLQLGTFSADISAFTYPDEMTPHDGFAEPMYTGQKRPAFNLSYRSLIGNGAQGLSYGYRLHLIFNCMLAPTPRPNDTLNDVSKIVDFEWKLSTTPIFIPFNRPSAHFVLDSRIVVPEALEAIENLLYGTDDSDAIFPTVQQLLDIFEATAIFSVVDNGDGTVTIVGPDEWVFPVGSDEVSISSPSFNQIDDTRIFTTSY